MCEILNIADAIVILALDTADCMPIRIPAKWLSLLHSQWVPAPPTRVNARIWAEYRKQIEVHIIAEGHLPFRFQAIRTALYTAWPANARPQALPECGQGWRISPYACPWIYNELLWLGTGDLNASSLGS